MTDVFPSRSYSIVRRAKIAFLSVALLIFSSETLAGTIVDTGPAQISSLPVYHDRNGDHQFLAGLFTTTEDTKITEVNGWLGVFQPGVLKIGLAENANGKPGSGLFSQALSLLEPADNDWRGVTNLAWYIAPGSYWVTFGADVGSVVGVMRTGVENPMAGYSFNSSGNNQWLIDNSLDIGVQVFGDLGVVAPPMSPVPEPSTYGMIAGLLLLAVVVGRHGALKMLQPPV